MNSFQPASDKEEKEDVDDEVVIVSMNHGVGEISIAISPCACFVPAQGNLRNRFQEDLRVKLQLWTRVEDEV